MRFCSEVVLRTMVFGSLIAVTALHAESTPPGLLTATSALPSAVSVVRVDVRTGRLVRSVVVKAPAGAPSASSMNPQVRAMVEETAKNLDVNPLLVDSVIQVESNYNPYAISPKGAQGLMQLMPATARRFGVKNSFDPQQNIEGGVRYLKFLQETFQDDRLAVAAYNAGEKAVTKYGNVPPYRETVDYVAKVGRKYSQAQHAAPKSVTPAQVAEKSPSPEEETRHVVGYVDREGRLHISTR
jgi:soluble lytic murein transglycosylase-like protein